MTDGECSGGGAVFRAGFGVDAAEMVLDGFFTKRQRGGDLAIGFARRRERQHFGFAAAQPGRQRRWPFDMRRRTQRPNAGRFTAGADGVDDRDRLRQQGVGSLAAIALTGHAHELRPRRERPRQLLLQTFGARQRFGGIEMDPSGREIALAHLDFAEQAIDQEIVKVAAKRQ